MTQSQAEPEAKTPPLPAGDRHISPIGGRSGGGFSAKAAALAALAIGCGVFVAASWGQERLRPDPSADRPVRQVVAFEPARPTLSAPGQDPPRLQADATPIAQSSPETQNLAQHAEAALTAIRAAPILAFDEGGSNTGPRAEADARPPDIAGEPGQLDQLRRTAAVGLAQASRLPDRNFLILAGVSIPCILQTAMDTATPGYVACILPRAVFSDNGAVMLMEKGTRVLGEYRSSLRQGQTRLFVVWNRAVTPQGVAVSLASPAADPLGRAGFDGQIDTRFWARFGAAVLLSVVDDGTAGLAGGGERYQTARLPSDAAAIALQASVGIAPSLRKAQGSEVSIFVAQDLDFSTVYRLGAR
jgi:type IV secretion system protein VirB10